MYEVGQLVWIREQKWEVLEDKAADSGDHVLRVRGVDEEVQGKEFAFVYRANEGKAPLELIKPVPAQELKWELRATPTGWKRLHTAYQLSLTHNAQHLLGLARARLRFAPYQLEPVLRVMNAPRQRFLLAEDVGMGKTIEAGLILTELIARGRADRILVVVPASLQDQWSDEMRDKFGLNFENIDSDSLKNKLLPSLQAGANPWLYVPRAITSIDFVKQDKIKRALKYARWDVIIVDEAHYLSESGSDTSPNKTDRSRLGELLAGQCDSLLLLTATPHNGYTQGFYSLLHLLDDMRFSGPRDMNSEKVREVVIRRAKESIKNEDGSDLFIKRCVTPMHLTLSSKERAFFDAVTRYTNAQWRKLGKDKNERATVGFAMILLRKRLASSLGAIRASLQRRLDTLGPEKLAQDARLVSSYRGNVPLTEKQAEQAQRQLLTLAADRDQQALDNERKVLVRLLNQVPSLEQDSKAALLKRELDRFCNDAHEPRKVIVFTEYRDTQEYLREYLESRGYAGRIVLMHGALNRDERQRAEGAFHQMRSGILLATDAASEGLNFQDGCWTVFHYELPWNPNRLEQRNGRVDRWGQQRQVEVYNMITEDTLEDRILVLLEEKLKRIQDEVGSRTDVLGLVGPEELKLEELLMDQASQYEDDAESAYQQIELALDQKLQAAEQELKHSLAQLSLDPALFDRDDYERIARVRTATEHALPTAKEIEQFVVSSLRELGGRAEAVKELPDTWQLVVPPRLQGSGVEPAYPRATFKQSIALNDEERPPSVDYIALGHPLIESIVAAVKRDGREGGSLAGRMAYKVIRQGERGLLFTFLMRWQDGRGASVVDEMVPLFLPLDGTEDEVEEAARKGRAVLEAEEQPKNAPQALLRSVYEPLWSTLKARARNQAGLYSQLYAEHIRLQRQEQVSTLRRDLEHWAVERPKWIKEMIEARKDERRALPQVGLFEVERQRAFEAAETRRRRELQMELERIKSRRREREEELQQMEQIIPLEPEMIAALVIIPEKDC